MLYLELVLELQLGRCFFTLGARVVVVRVRLGLELGLGLGLGLGLEEVFVRVRVRVRVWVRVWVRVRVRVVVVWRCCQVRWRCARGGLCRAALPLQQAWAMGARYDASARAAQDQGTARPLWQQGFGSAASGLKTARDASLWHPGLNHVGRGSSTSTHNLTLHLIPNYESYVYHWCFSG